MFPSAEPRKLSIPNRGGLRKDSVKALRGDDSRASFRRVEAPDSNSRRCKEIVRRLTRPARRFGFDAQEARSRQIKPGNEGVDKRRRIVGLDIIIHRLRQQQKLVALEAGDVSHARFQRRQRHQGIRSGRLFARSACCGTRLLMLTRSSMA
jgi:hypothetical protein